jgi:group I intron endonuclease
MNNSGVYKITNIKTGRFYIGSTNNINKRWADHRRNLTNNTHDNPKLQHAWNFYGLENFMFELIEEIEPNPIILLEREQHYLDTWKPYLRAIGYNICSQAFGGDNFTYHPDKEVIRERMREISSGENNPMFGRNHSEKSIQLQKEKAIGRYTLEWFIDKYGDEVGNSKYHERCKKFTDMFPRNNYTKQQNLTFEGKKHTKDFSDKHQKTREYFKNHWNEFVQLVLSDKYTQRQLSKMLGISRVTLRIKMNAIKRGEVSLTPHD